MCENSNAWDEVAHVARQSLLKPLFNGIAAKEPWLFTNNWWTQVDLYYNQQGLLLLGESHHMKMKFTDKEPWHICILLSISSPFQEYNRRAAGESGKLWHFLLLHSPYPQTDAHSFCFCDIPPHVSKVNIRRFRFGKIRNGKRRKFRLKATGNIGCKSMGLTA